MMWLFSWACVSDIVEAQPEDNRVQVEFLIHPEQANLSIDGAQSSAHTALLERGTHTVEVSLDGYETHRASIQVPLPEASHAIQLKPLLFSVEFWVQEAQSISIQAQEEQWSVKNGETLDLPFGVYRFTAQAAKGAQYSWTQKITQAGIIRRCIPKSSEQHLQCLWRVACGKAPKAVAFSPDGSEMWVALLMGPIAIEIYDTSTWKKKAEIDLNASGAVEFVFAPDGHTVYASQMQSSSIFEIDRATKKILRQLPSKGAWTKVLAINENGDRLYASNWVSDDVSELDLTKGVVHRKWKTAEEPRGLYLSKDQNFLYIVTYKGGTLERVDLRTGEKTQIFATRGSLRHIAADEDRGLLFISDMRNACIWKHDISTGQTERFIKTESHPNTIVLSDDKRLLFVSNRGRNHPESYTRPGPEYGVVQVFDAHTGQLQDAAVGRNQPTGLDLLPKEAILASSDFWDANVNVYTVPPSSVFLKEPSKATQDYRSLMRKPPKAR